MADYAARFANLSRGKKVALQRTVDACVILFSFIAAVYLRTESLHLLQLPEVWLTLMLSVPATLAVFSMLGLYRNSVRYLTGGVLATVLKGAVASGLTIYIASLIFAAPIPRSAPIINAVFVFLSVGGIRFVVRQLFRDQSTQVKRPVIIFGAGEAGLQVLNALTHGKEYLPIALVDDDEKLHNLNIGGLKVHCPDQIPQIVAKTGAEIVLLAAPSMGRERKRRVLAEAASLQVEFKTIPGMSDIVSGKAKISELRTVSAEDLLGRDPVKPVSELLRRNITGKVVMVSGAGGSIGSELCRQILTQEPEMLVLFEMSEFALYAIEAELTASVARMTHKPRIIPLLGSVQHRRRLEVVIKAFRVQTIYHAAAYKHVPLVEENVVEGIRNNVFGTLEISSAAEKCGVENFILISTDKAVRPTNIMGASKRLAELICQAKAQQSKSTVFSMVRFGNVLGSSGSVIPKFQEQIANGGPITVTHRDINRYFMTIPEAAQLVIQAGAMAKGGDVFVLDMGDPVKILDLALSMVKMHGLTPYIVDHRDEVHPQKGDIPICVTGLRKGEKLYEELLIGNHPGPTQHARIMTASEVSVPMAELTMVLNRLLLACKEFDYFEILSIMKELPLEYTPLNDSAADLLWVAVRAEEKHTIMLEKAERTA